MIKNGHEFLPSHNGLKIPSSRLLTVVVCIVHYLTTQNESKALTLFFTVYFALVKNAAFLY